MSKITSSSESHSENADKNLPLKHYVFQWRDNKQRRIGPFSDQEKATEWAEAFKTIYPNTLWLIEALTDNQVYMPPNFIPVDYSGIKDAFEIPISADGYDFIMRWGSSFPLTFYGPFFNTKGASQYIANVFDNRIADCVVRRLQRSDMVEPIVVLSPRSILILPLEMS